MQTHNEKNEIAFTDDIVEDVAKELGMSKEKIAYHVDFMVHWIKKLTKIPEVLAIFIPHIGTMYVNWGKIQNEVDYFGKMPEDELPTQWKNRLRDNRIRIAKLEETFKDNDGYIRHKKRQKIFNVYHTKGKNLKELESWQNKQ